MEKDSVTVAFEFHRDFMTRPELLPLLLRNLVVKMTEDFPDDYELFSAYMKIVARLDAAFSDELREV